MGKTLDSYLLKPPLDLSMGEFQVGNFSHTRTLLMNNNGIETRSKRSRQFYPYYVRWGIQTMLLIEDFRDFVIVSNKKDICIYTFVCSLYL